MKPPQRKWGPEASGPGVQWDEDELWPMVFQYRYGGSRAGGVGAMYVYASPATPRRLWIEVYPPGGGTNQYGRIELDAKNAKRLSESLARAVRTWADD